LIYYKISLITSPLNPLTYHSKEDIKDGTIVNIALNNRETKGVVISTCQEPNFKTNEIVAIGESYFSKEQIELAFFISSYYICSLGDAFALMVPFLAQVKTWVPMEFNDSLQPRLQPGQTGHKSKLTQENSSVLMEIQLSKKQSHALEFLKQHKVSLLFGDTGSGKTEIYMSYFEDIIASNKRVIFLMPEISLTPQMEDRLKKYFGDSVVMWHSKLTPKQKKLSLKKIYSGEAKIIAGPRSALFLPIKELGLIVVDEEHDDSYKSNKRPRYNARDIAIYMGKLYNIPVVLGSATPSLSSYVKFPHARVKGGHFLSQKEFIYERSVEDLTPLIFSALKESLKQKEQTIVFLPTRANFKYLICGDCGHTYECVFCSIGMSIHQKSRALKCHYCNYAQAIPQVCSKCGGSNLASSRLGTAEAVKNISDEFPHAVVEQFDRDVITTQAKLKKALKRFNDKEIDILVGTQMLSKGHDYHGVTLAVVLGMDNMLNMSDYRAREKALSSLIQVAGRSGRKKGAKVLVQSFNGEFFSAFVDNYEDFLEEEKLYREGLYPPYKKLCRILFAHKNGAKARDEMQKMYEKLCNMPNIEVVGHGKCAIERVANKYRFEILLRSNKSTDIIKAVKFCKVDLAEVDMDPIEFG
jgi:primosomal protein N' (replication factor Y)